MRTIARTALAGLRSRALCSSTATITASARWPRHCPGHPQQQQQQQQQPSSARPFSTNAEAVASCKELIASADVVVFAKTTCGFCARVEDLLEYDLTLDPPPLFVQLNRREDGGDLQRALMDMTGQRTVPNVWVKGKHIGGCDDTFRAYADGSLEKLLDA